ncbi:uncharacterized protein [Diadema antillarum]|uniref:uncharacterized protein n=1 Tax=Diadema antillarum TaxID=105358 RepID=UPI003A887913
MILLATIVVGLVIVVTVIVCVITAMKTKRRKPSHSTGPARQSAVNQSVKSLKPTADGTAGTYMGLDSSKRCQSEYVSLHDVRPTQSEGAVNAQTADTVVDHSYESTGNDGEYAAYNEQADEQSPEKGQIAAEHKYETTITDIVFDHNYETTSNEGGYPTHNERSEEQSLPERRQMVADHKYETRISMVPEGGIAGSYSVPVGSQGKEQPSTYIEVIE